MPIKDLLTIFSSNHLQNAHYIRNFAVSNLIIHLKISIMKVSKINDYSFMVDGNLVDVSGKRCRFDGKVVDKYSLAYFLIHLPGCYNKFLYFEVYNSSFTYNEIYDSFKSYLAENVCS